jgi:hypothetical protein
MNLWFKKKELLLQLSSSVPTPPPSFSHPARTNLFRLEMEGLWSAPSINKVVIASDDQLYILTPGTQDLIPISPKGWLEYSYNLEYEDDEDDALVVGVIAQEPPSGPSPIPAAKSVPAKPAGNASPKPATGAPKKDGAAPQASSSSLPSKAVAQKKPGGK